jgi:hypothetical protein
MSADYCPLEKFSTCSNMCAWYLEPLSACSLSQTALSLITLTVALNELVQNVRLISEKEKLKDGRN